MLPSPTRDECKSPYNKILIISHEHFCCEGLSIYIYIYYIFVFETPKTTVCSEALSSILLL